MCHFSSGALGRRTAIGGSAKPVARKRTGDRYLKPDQATYWFMMQIDMLAGYGTSFPMNWWLIRSKIKEAM